MALELKDIQREGMLAGIIAERDEIILNQAQLIQSRDAQIKALQDEVEKFQAKVEK